MLKAAVPRNTVSSSRPARPPAVKSAQDSAKLGRTRSGRVRDGSRASCFHRAIRFSTMVATAVPWMTLISLIWLNSWSSPPTTRADTPMPTSSMT